VTPVLLLPRDPLGHGPDAHFAAEAAAAAACGWRVALIDDEQLRRGDARGASHAVPAGIRGLWRGWMLRGEEYAALEQALRSQASTLITSAEAYRTAHELPGWYAAFTAHTAPSTWWPQQTLAHGFETLLTEAAGALPPGAAIVKDYVKSEKQAWAEACYVPDVRDRSALARVLTRFLELRGDDLTGGIVLRHFEEYIGAEARSWWVNGEACLVTAHPDTPSAGPKGLRPEDLGWLRAAVQALAAPFVTVDLTRHVDGRWRVVEVGDGQVSDRPSSLSAETLLQALTSLGVEA
jgi:hypothetical protein